MTGSLVIVGTGLRPGDHATRESQSAIRSADRVFFVPLDDFGADWIRSLNQRSTDLRPLYQAHDRRADTYAAMAAKVLAAAHAGKDVCFALYGHPGVFATPAHAALTAARDQGINAQLLPAISATDCLYADLEIDPAVDGVQEFDATDFLVRHRDRFDTHVGLVLWQIGYIGKATPSADAQAWNSAGVRLLSEALVARYGHRHRGIVYEAATLGLASPLQYRCALSRLDASVVPRAATLYVPPLARPKTDRKMLKLLGLPGR